MTELLCAVLAFVVAAPGIASRLVVFLFGHANRRACQGAARKLDGPAAGPRAPSGGYRRWSLGNPAARLVDSMVDDAGLEPATPGM